MFIFENLKTDCTDPSRKTLCSDPKMSVSSVTINQVVFPIQLPLDGRYSMYGLTVITGRKTFTKKIPILKNGRQITIGAQFIVDCCIISGIAQRVTLRITFKSDRLKKYITATSATITTPSEPVCIQLNDEGDIAEMIYSNLMSFLKPSESHRVCKQNFFTSIMPPEHSRKDKQIKNHVLK